MMMSFLSSWSVPIHNGRGRRKATKKKKKKKGKERKAPPVSIDSVKPFPMVGLGHGVHNGGTPTEGEGGMRVNVTHDGGSLKSLGGCYALMHLS